MTDSLETRQLDRFRHQLANVDDPTAEAVLCLHCERTYEAGCRWSFRQDMVGCGGCPWNHEYDEPYPWPCWTVLTVADALGIEAP